MPAYIVSGLRRTNTSLGGGNSGGGCESACARIETRRAAVKAAKTKYGHACGELTNPLDLRAAWGVF